MIIIGSLDHHWKNTTDDHHGDGDDGVYGCGGDDHVECDDENDGGKDDVDDHGHGYDSDDKRFKFLDALASLAFKLSVSE